MKHAGRYRRSLPLSLIYFCSPQIFLGVFVLLMFLWFSYNLCLNGNQAYVFAWFLNLNEPPLFLCSHHPLYVHQSGFCLNKGKDAVWAEGENLPGTIRRCSVTSMHVPDFICLEQCWRFFFGGGQFMDQHLWGKNDGRARRDRGHCMLHWWLASLTVREKFYGCWWKIVPGITWLQNHLGFTMVVGFLKHKIRILGLI